MSVNTLISGYMLLPKCCDGSYCGVDRHPFEPAILPEALEETSFLSDELAHSIWAMYPKGWRRDVYKIYEAHSVNSQFNSLYLVAELEAAKEILSIVNQNIDPHEIVYCQLGEISNRFQLALPSVYKLMGFDIAYAGGDYYSAVKNGFLGTYENSLSRHFRNTLNHYGLFTNQDFLAPYLREFKKEFPSEENADFLAYLLWYVE